MDAALGRKPPKHSQARLLDGAEHRTAIDYAQQMKYLVGEHYPEAIKIIIVQDQLSTHVATSLYKAYALAEAKRIPEIELSVLNRQCLDRRVPDQDTSDGILPHTANQQSDEEKGGDGHQRRRKWLI